MRRFIPASTVSRSPVGTGEPVSRARWCPAIVGASAGGWLWASLWRRWACLTACHLTNALACITSPYPPPQSAHIFLHPHPKASMPELLGRLQSALADRYRLDREVGAGGMATVYLAEDVRHDRRVALKVLRPELAAVIGAERFLAEIKLTANLQHPHILPLFDSGEADGYLFYVMPFIQGETLRDRLTREKQLPVADAIRITTEVARALDYAHRHGVIHRDIKPENILLHDGQALVADFGIALAASKAGGSRMTETGMSLGTPHYMSPRAGDGRARDHRPLRRLRPGRRAVRDAQRRAAVHRGDGAGGGRAGGDREPAPAPPPAPHHSAPRRGGRDDGAREAPADRFATAAEFAEALRDKSYHSTASMPAAEAPAPAATAPRGRAPPAGRPRAGARRGAGRRHRRRALGLAPPGAGAAGEPVQPRAQGEPGAAAAEQRRRSAHRDLGRRPGAGVHRSRGERHPPLAPALDQLEATPIAGTDGASHPFFSPDGNRVGFIRNGTEVRIASLAGAPTVTLSDKVNSSAADWGDDGYVYFEVDSGLARMRATGGEIEPVYKIQPKAKEIATEWVHVLPGAKGILFRLRHVGAGPGRLRDHGDAAAAGHGAVAGPRRLRDLLAHGPSPGRHLGRQADRHPVRPEEAPAHRRADRAARGDRGAERRIQHRPLARPERHAGLHHRRHARLPPRGVGEPRGAGDAGGLRLGSAGCHRVGEPVARREAACGRADARRPPGHLGQAAPSGPFSRITFSDTSSGRPAWSADGRDVLYAVDRSGRASARSTPAARTAPARPGCWWAPSMSDRPRRRATAGG